jgi:hypothetical protein
MAEARGFAARPVARNIASAAAATEPSTKEETFQYQAEVSFAFHACSGRLL